MFAAPVCRCLIWGTGGYINFVRPARRKLSSSHLLVSLNVFKKHIFTSYVFFSASLLRRYLRVFKLSCYCRMFVSLPLCSKYLGVLKLWFSHTDVCRFCSESAQVHPKNINRFIHVCPLLFKVCSNTSKKYEIAKACLAASVSKVYSRSFKNRGSGSMSAVFCPKPFKYLQKLMIQTTCLAVSAWGSAQNLLKWYHWMSMSVCLCRRPQIFKILPTTTPYVCFFALLWDLLKITRNCTRENACLSASVRLFKIRSPECYISLVDLSLSLSLSLSARDTAQNLSKIVRDRYHILL